MKQLTWKLDTKLGVWKRSLAMMWFRVWDYRDAAPAIAYFSLDPGSDD
jgi:hypothetical protein